MASFGCRVASLNSRVTARPSLGSGGGGDTGKTAPGCLRGAGHQHQESNRLSEPLTERADDQITTESPVTHDAPSVGDDDHILVNTVTIFFIYFIGLMPCS